MKDIIKKMFTSGLIVYLFQLVLILAIFDLAIIPGINAESSPINALSVVSALVLMVYAGYLFDYLLNNVIDTFSEGDEVKNEEKDSNI